MTFRLPGLFLSFELWIHTSSGACQTIPLLVFKALQHQHVLNQAYHLYFKTASPSKSPQLQECHSRPQKLGMILRSFSSLCFNKSTNPAVSPQPHRMQTSSRGPPGAVWSSPLSLLPSLVSGSHLLSVTHGQPQWPRQRWTWACHSLPEPSGASLCLGPGHLLLGQGSWAGLFVLSLW